MSTLTPLLSQDWHEPDSVTLAGYERNDGYKGLRAALQRQPPKVNPSKTA